MRAPSPAELAGALPLRTCFSSSLMFLYRRKAPSLHDNVHIVVDGLMRSRAAQCPACLQGFCVGSFCIVCMSGFCAVLAYPHCPPSLWCSGPPMVAGLFMHCVVALPRAHPLFAALAVAGPQSWGDCVPFRASVGELSTPHASPPWRPMGLEGRCMQRPWASCVWEHHHVWCHCHQAKG